MAGLDLAGLWRSIAEQAEAERDHLNELDDVGGGDAGDNYQTNMRLVAETLERELGGGGGDVGRALQQAARTLESQGRGATAPIYAAGFADAAQQLTGRSGLSADDLMPLLEGLLRGAQSRSDVPQGQGGLLDALVPGVMGYLGARQRGAYDMEALIEGLTGARRGTYGTRRSSPQMRNFGDTRGQLDPGAAGIGSLFEGLLRGLLQQGGSSTSLPQSAPQRNRDDFDGVQM